MAEQRLRSSPAEWAGQRGDADRHGVPAVPDWENSCGCLNASDGLDDATTGYIVATRMPFEQLRQASGQLAALLVLAASGARNWAGHPMLALAGEARRAAEDAIRSTCVPPAALHHHKHLMQAARAVARAEAKLRNASTRRNDETIDDVLAAVQTACRELQWSTSALPGFEMVALSQSCCAAHAAPRGAALALRSE